MPTIDEAMAEAEALRRAGRMRDAAGLYRRILAVSPGHLDAAYRLALAVIAMGAPGEARPLVAALERDVPGNADVLALKVKLLFAEGGTREATALAGAGLAATPDAHGLRQALLEGMAAHIRADARFAGDRLAAARTPPSPIQPVSVIACSIDPEKWRGIAGNMEALLGGTGYELIGIHDARSLCEGFARGFARARGDIIIFCHDDIELLDDCFAVRVAALLERFDVIGLAGTTCLGGASWFTSGWPHQQGIIAHRRPADTSYRVDVFGLGGAVTGGIEALDGLFMAARRDVVERIGFDAATFDGFHLYDTDFSYRAHLAGYRIALAHEIPVIHASTGNMGGDWAVQADRFLSKFAGRVPAGPRGPNPFRAAFLATRDQVRALHRAQIALREGQDWVTALDRPD